MIRFPRERSRRSSCWRKTCLGFPSQIRVLAISQFWLLGIHASVPGCQRQSVREVEDKRKGAAEDRGRFILCAYNTFYRNTRASVSGQGQDSVYEIQGEEFDRPREQGGVVINHADCIAEHEARSSRLLHCSGPSGILEHLDSRLRPRSLESSGS